VAGLTLAQSLLLPTTFAAALRTVSAYFAGWLH
jgi:hypothetical protein